MPLVKRLLFKHYWWASLALLAVVLIAASWRGLFTDPTFTIALTGTIISLFFFVQKQALEETWLLKELFESFNARYDEMNKDLAEIAAPYNHEELSPTEKTVLVDYFNLCAEEYLYFRRGYLPPEVWESWSRGMSFYWKNDRIQPFWEYELKTGSYYGFRLETTQPVPGPM